jgi:hypothetical protein
MHVKGHYDSGFFEKTDNKSRSGTGHPEPQPCDVHCDEGHHRLALSFLPVCGRLQSNIKTQLAVATGFPNRREQLLCQLLCHISPSFLSSHPVSCPLTQLPVLSTGLLSSHPVSCPLTWSPVLSPGLLSSQTVSSPLTRSPPLSPSLRSPPGLRALDQRGLGLTPLHCRCSSRFYQMSSLEDLKKHNQTVNLF